VVPQPQQKSGIPEPHKKFTARLKKKLGPGPAWGKGNGVGTTAVLGNRGQGGGRFRPGEKGEKGGTHGWCEKKKRRVREEKGKALPYKKSPIAGGRK